MKRVLYIFLAFFVLYIFYGCAEGELDFSDKSKIVDIRVNSSGSIAVLYKSNEIVNVYSFEKLTKTFEREGYFLKVKGKTNVIGSFFKIKDFGLAESANIFFIVGNKPTLGWIVQLEDKQFGTYSYVTEVVVSKDGKRFGFIYNMGGVFDGTNLINGKYYVNVDGVDYGPYDYATNLNFSEDGDSYFFVYKNQKYWYVNENGVDHNAFDEVILPIFLSGYNGVLTFAYRIRNNYFLSSGQKLEAKGTLVNLLISDKGIGSIYLDKTNVVLEIDNLNFTNSMFTNITLKDGGILVFSSLESNFVFYKNKLFGPYPEIKKAMVYKDKLVLKCLSNGVSYLYLGDKLISSYEEVDFSVSKDGLIIAYVEGNKVKKNLIK